MGNSSIYPHRQDWKRALILLGNRAMGETRMENAVGCYRMSESFMYDGDTDKRAYHEKATTLFYGYYKDCFENGMVERYYVR